MRIWYFFLLGHVIANSGYCFWKEYIVDNDFEEDDFQAVPLLVKARKGKPRYMPARDELLKYSEWDYYEITPQLTALKAHLSGLISDPEKVLEIIEEIHDMSAAGVRMQEYFDLLDEAGIVFDGLEQVNVITQLLVDVHNNTRLWSNYGHTPSELSGVRKSNLQPFPSVQPKSGQKTGRNEPCPCGSGKKYKNCCGK
jgi:hypothetical protein